MNSSAANPNTPQLSVVVPAYNEEEVISEFHQRLSAVLDQIPNSEIIYVNDGSNDGTLELLTGFRDADQRIAIVDLSRNFGKELATTAGLDHSRGDAVVLIDADLQDPPELIPKMLLEWQKGFDVVYMQRSRRDGESALKKFTAWGFYRVLNKLSSVDIPANVGDFRILSRRVVDVLCQLRERNRFMKGLFAWIGFSQKSMSYQRDARFAGDTKWNYLALWNLAVEGITSFSVSPLKLASYIGFFTAAGAFFYGFWVILKTVLFGEPVPGYPTLMVVILFLGGMQLMALGVIGEYLGRMFIETKQRPLYLLNQHYPSHTATERSNENPPQ
ncbi:MAG: glycosyltransferase family 2 protein [Gammaproteobacteria bacterium]|nr:glycosyltransferase family 2 protein [Gammaproteobacteria bacterium]